MTPTKINDKLLSWASDLEPEAQEQAERTSRMPFVASHVALMPDAHFGLGATVGSVIATQGAIMPAAVGVDIGCGMIAQDTGLLAADLPDSLEPLMPLFEDRIPAGVGRGRVKDTPGGTLGDLGPKLGEASSFRYMPEKLRGTARNQIGSLGSGNHFVEVCLDERQHVWVVLHSGSRGVGNKLAQQHIKTAQGLMKAWFIDLEDPDLAYLVQDTTEFDHYIADMLWAQDYAAENRERMLLAAVASLMEIAGRYEWTPVETVNCHHNFTKQEHHHGRNVWLTRKGAISARLGERGVIPGSMGTASFIVQGRGNPASFFSCSHGAGRRMSRSRARRELTLASLEEAMAGKTWNHDKAGALLDEHPASYKDIDQVMADQADLVEITHTLHQVFNYKGS